MTLRGSRSDKARHGSTESSSAESWRSTDTIKAVPSNLSRVSGLTCDIAKRNGASHSDPEISPRSAHAKPAFTDPRPQGAPWATGADAESDQSKDQQRTNKSEGGPSSAARWPSSKGDRPPPMPSSIFTTGGSFFSRSSENLGQVSPGHVLPGSYPEGRDDRRPSIASQSTVSSTGSKPSINGRFHKKLQGFFGDEYGQSDASRQNSEASSIHRMPSYVTSIVGGRNRNNSMNDAIPYTGPSSPMSSRPRTPVHAPNSDVTPWVFQENSTREVARDTYFPEGIRSKPPKNSTSHRLHLPGHRHNHSHDEKSAPNNDTPVRPATSREMSQSMRREGTQGSVSGPNNNNNNNMKSRPPSPTPSAYSTKSSLHQKQTNGQQVPKRSLFDRVTGRHKHDKAPPDSLTSNSVSSLPPAPASSKIIRDDKRPRRQPDATEPASSGKDNKSRLPFKKGKDGTPDGKVVKDPNLAGANVGSALYHLDTDITSMEGIINNDQNMPLPPANEIFAGNQPEQAPKPDNNRGEHKGVWDAPESWAVRRVPDENVQRLGEVDETGAVRRADEPGPMYCIRIFKADGSHAVIPAPINTTAAELIGLMVKKSYLPDDLDTYQIVMRRQNTIRQLEPGERPLVMQRRLLKMAGYEDNDQLEDLGRGDHGYLCRFTFLSSKMSGYSILDRDPGFNKMQRFSHIDLSGRNLVTIPITLYQRATEIMTLNLSHNLKLDIPKDFVQSCTQLREIRYTGNEAWKLPASLSLASKLTILDISNNCLEQLEHTEMWRLTNLVSLKLSNNKLASVPPYFADYHALRSLNLSSNSLVDFPAAVLKLTTLKDLDVSFNSISTLGNLSSLVNLERLWATNNKLSGSLDESFGELSNLKEVDARFNAIANIDVISKLPKLELLMLGHNSLSQFEGSFQSLRVLFLNHNPVTNFDLNAPVPSLTVLNLASAKLSRLPDALFSKMSNLTKLTISKNHFHSLSPQFGSLSKLEYLSIAKNELSKLPVEIGRLTELRYLDVRENNLEMLPSEIWYAKRLETLNVSSNVLSDFPKPGAPLPPLPDVATTPLQQPPVDWNTSPDSDEPGKLEDFQMRRPSQASGKLSVSSSPGGSTSRKGSVVSYNSSKPSTMARTNTSTTLAAIGPSARKDSTLSGRLASTFASTLRHLFLADNRLEDDVFNELVLLSELRILNLSYNQLYDIPPRTIRRWTHLTELYLSGNDLTSLPSEDLDEGSSLKVLHINNNKFQVLPAELGKVQKLAILDVGGNTLKYNVSNWPYDWNWNWNHQLRYLNLSGNKRLEIKPSQQSLSGRDARDLTDFSSLTNLRILGLMDVTLTIPSIPDQGPDRRVRTAGSIIGTSMPYGMADTLGRNEHLSTLDMVVPRFRGHEDETLIGLFDGQSLSSGGSRIAKYLHDKFKHFFIEELDRTKTEETPVDALRRTYLALNKELATAATHAIEARDHPSSALVHRGSFSGPELSDDDLSSGSVATVMYLHGMELYMSNVGDAQALLIQSEGGHRVLTRRHDPAEASERARLRAAGGYVSRQGRLNDQLEVSRAFGYVHLTPCVIAAPHICKVDIKESDEIILIASRELWDYLTPDFAVDVARQERGDLMRAAQKLRDLAIAFGATGKIMVMMVGVSDLRKRERAKFRTPSMSMGPSGAADDYFTTVRKGRRGRDAVIDSRLARLDHEVDAPLGDVTLVFTDIKNSTILWETCPIAMQSAIKMHNEVMRRHLRIIGGYEVKTEGDAFMVAFPTVTSALLWAFTIQTQLLEVQWPQEILNSPHGEEVVDSDGNIIFRGLSVRMGIHWGRPVCEIDPVTRRMDYFGPMVNRAARIQGVADGGQICVSSDFIQEVQRMLESHIESDRSGSTGSEETLSDDVLSQAIRRELRSLSSQGFEVKDLGQRNLKGLENPEYIYSMYPHSLASRLVVQSQKAEAESRAQQMSEFGGGAMSTGHYPARKPKDSALTIETDTVWALWNVSLRLEMLCSTLESTNPTYLKAPETAIIELLKEHGGEVTDSFLMNFLEHQTSRIETCISTLAVRNLVRPFKNGMLSQAGPMSDILDDLSSQLNELKMLKEQIDFDMAPS